MVPTWLSLLINSWPLLILISIAITVFGILRMRAYIAKRSEEKAEEEQKRIEFLSKMKVKLGEKNLG